MDLVEKQNNKVDKKIIPALRFPDFVNDGEWEKDAFENTFLFLPNNTLSRAELNYENGSTKNIHYGDVLIRFGDCLDVQANALPFISDEAIADRLQRSRLQDGDVIFADTAEDETVGKCTEIFNVYSENVVSGLHTIPIRPKKQFAIPYLGFYFNSDSYRKQLLPLMQGVKVMSISKTAIGKTIIAYPNLLSEQSKIGSCLISMDAYISATKEKLELLKTYKKGLLQKLFSAKGKKLPELRFKEFENDGEWEEKKLGEVTKDVNRRNKSNRNLPIYSISNKDGFILQSEQFDGLDSVSRGYDTSLYKIVTSNTFAYNPARINVGSIGHSGNIKESLVSSLYVCFKTTEDVDDSFLMYFFDTSAFQQSVENNVEGGIRSYLFYENFSKIKIMLPTVLEQKKITSCLKAVDEEINAVSDKATELEKQKTGLMQKLFPITK